MPQKIKVAIIGLGFGAEFVPIDQAHPHAVQSANWTCVGLCAQESTPTGGKFVKLPALTQHGLAPPKTR